MSKSTLHKDVKWDENYLQAADGRPIAIVLESVDGRHHGFKLNMIFKEGLPKAVFIECGSGYDTEDEAKIAIGLAWDIRDGVSGS